MPGSIGHSPSLPLRAASPLSEGAKAPVRLPERLTAERKPSPWGEGGTAQAVTDVGSLIFQSSPNIVPGPLHTRHGLWPVTPSVSRRGLPSGGPTPYF